MNKYHGSVLTVIQLHWDCLRSRCVCFPSLHCSDSRSLRPEPSDAGLGLLALSRSKPLRFRVWATPQRCRLGWACVSPVPCPSSSGDRVLGACSCPQLEAATHPLPRPSRSVFWVYNGRAFSGVPCVYSGERVSGCDPLGGCRPSRIPRSLG